MDDITKKENSNTQFDPIRINQQSHLYSWSKLCNADHRGLKNKLIRRNS